jgi:hypothetical protein
MLATTAAWGVVYFRGSNKEEFVEIMAKKALITGIAGQDGGHLAKLLHEKGYEVYGVVRGQMEASHPRYKALKEEMPYAELVMADLLDLSALTRAVQTIRPDDYFKREGNDLYVDQHIPFTLAALGGEVNVRTLDGTLKLKVRAGTQSHTLVRLRNEGVKRLQGNGRGDLYVRLIVKVPEKLSREQKKAIEQLQKLSD